MSFLAGSGGPGTVFYMETGPSAADPKLVVDNYGKSTYIAMDTSCSALDVLKQGNSTNYYFVLINSLKTDYSKMMLDFLICINYNLKIAFRNICFLTR